MSEDARLLVPILQEELAARIGDARRMRRMPSGATARLLGLDETALSKMETGRRTISALELAALAVLYRVPLADFFVPRAQWECRDWSAGCS